MKSRVFYLAIIIVGVILSFSLARNLYTTYQNSKILTDAQIKLSQLTAQNTQLSQEINQASTPDYVIKEARDKLGLVKSGEVVVVVPRQVATLAAATPSAQPSRPIWRQWLSLFFGV